MKTIKCLPLAAGLLAASTASALIDIETVQVGDAGNANDSTGFGGVSNSYYIGTYEVTNRKYPNPSWAPTSAMRRVPATRWTGC